MTHHFGWWYDGTFDDVVGDVEQARQEDLVACDAFSLIGFTICHWWRILQDETAFRTNRYDNCVFNLLRFDQTEDFSTEVFTTIRPTQTTASDFTAAQMHAFYTW